ncbi:MAG: hypothetical protein H6558_08760 [Lewinellaceae bacterium]|nr:hypothetical protein [Lewinellaceae bacterium]
MSDKRKDNKAILSTLQKELEDILLKAADAGQELDATRRRIVDAQVRASHEMLEHIEAINLLRGEIREMLNNLEGFEPEDMEAVQYMGEQLVLHLCSILSLRNCWYSSNNAAGNGRSFDEQLREQVIERLDEFTFFPGQKENDARKMVLSNLTQVTSW